MNEDYHIISRRFGVDLVFFLKEKWLSFLNSFLLRFASLDFFSSTCNQSICMLFGSLLFFCSYSSPHFLLVCTWVYLSALFCKKNSYVVVCCIFCSFIIFLLLFYFYDCALIIAPNVFIFIIFFDIFIIFFFRYCSTRVQFWHIFIFHFISFFFTIFLLFVPASFSLHFPE